MSSLPLSRKAPPRRPTGRATAVWLSVCLAIPVLSILALYQLNTYASNTLALYLLVITCAFPLLVAAKRLPVGTHGVAIWATAITLLWANSLVSPSFRTTDASVEFYFANRVLHDGFWEQGLASPLNGMLSVTVFPAVLSSVSRTDLTDFYKWIVPLTSSLVPVGLYRIYSRWLPNDLAFLASFLFVSQATFFTWTGLTAKQSVASVFLMVFLLSLTRRGTDWRKGLLLAIPLAGVAVSHYGTTYLLLFGLLWLIGLSSVNHLLSSVKGYLSGRETSVTKTLVLLFVVLSLMWYSSVARSSPLTTFVDYIRFVVRNLMGFPPSLMAGGTTLLNERLGPTLTAIKFLHLALLPFALVGCFVRRPQRVDANRPLIPFEFWALAVFFLGAMLSLAIGRLSDVDAGRVLYLAMFFLAPFVVLGLQGVTESALSRVAILSRDRLQPGFSGSGHLHVVIVAAFAALFLAFNSGLVAEGLLKDAPGASVGLSLPRVQRAESFHQAEYFYRVYATQYDIASAIWLGRYRDVTTVVYADVKGGWNSLASYGGIPFEEASIRLLRGDAEVARGRYVYLRYFNVRYQVVQESAVPLRVVNLEDLAWLPDRSRVYDNRFSQVYR